MACPSTKSVVFSRVSVSLIDAFPNHSHGSSLVADETQYFQEILSRRSFRYSIAETSAQTPGIRSEAWKLSVLRDRGGLKTNILARQKTSHFNTSIQIITQIRTSRFRTTNPPRTGNGPSLSERHTSHTCLPQMRGLRLGTLLMCPAPFAASIRRNSIHPDKKSLAVIH